jgi:hypothetical protein
MRSKVRGFYGTSNVHKINKKLIKVYIQIDRMVLGTIKQRQGFYAKSITLECPSAVGYTV